MSLFQTKVGVAVWVGGWGGGWGDSNDITRKSHKRHDVWYHRNFIVCSTACSGVHHIKHQSSVLLTPCEGNPQVTEGFPHKGSAEIPSGSWRHKEKYHRKSPNRSVFCGNKCTAILNSTPNAYKFVWNSFHNIPYEIDTRCYWCTIYHPTFTHAFDLIWFVLISFFQSSLVVLFGSRLTLFLMITWQILRQNAREVTLKDVDKIDWFLTHYSDVIMGAIASQITSLTIVYSSVYSAADQRKH